ncbi:glycosyltransferase family 2 protein, partial [bacterium]|nr:glycosyltransferase family 2 protein [bacterium]
MPKTVLLRIPCYNHEPFIRGCLASVAAQDYPALAPRSRPAAT